MPGRKCISKKELCQVLNFERPNHIPTYKVKIQALSLDLPQWIYKTLLTTKRIHRNYIHTYPGPLKFSVYNAEPPPYLLRSRFIQLGWSPFLTSSLRDTEAAGPQTTGPISIMEEQLESRAVLSRFTNTAGENAAWNQNTTLRSPDLALVPTAQIREVSSKWVTCYIICFSVCRTLIHQREVKII